MKKTIDLISTGSTKDPESLQKVFRMIEGWGYVPRASKTIFGEHPLYANTDKVRLDNLVEALYAEDSDIVWCFGGGCGTTRLLPFLQALKPPSKPKMIIGLSDVTALLLFLSQKWGWQVVHAPVAIQLVTNRINAEAAEALTQLIQGQIGHLRYDALIPLNESAREPAVIQGLLTGGNMSLIQYSIGSAWQIETDNRILFFEDINEEAYRIAERLEHLKQAGIFQKAKAVLFGDFLHTQKEKYHPDLVDFVLKDFAELIKIPCFFNLPVGHRDFCRPLIMNRGAVLTTGQQGQLVQSISK